MTDLTRCVDQHCPWRKECIRSCDPKKVEAGDAYFVSPRTEEGCQYFLTIDLIQKRKNPTKDI